MAAILKSIKSTYLRKIVTKFAKMMHTIHVNCSGCSNVKFLIRDSMFYLINSNAKKANTDVKTL